MGSWGCKPFDDDQACDFLDDLAKSKNVVPIIKDALEKGEEGEVRAAAHFLCIIRKYIVDPSLYEQHIKVAVVEMEALLKNKDYTGDWDDPAAIKKAIKKQLTALKKCQ